VKGRGSPHEMLENLRQPRPLAEKVRLLLRNRVLAVVRGGCCGHPGEPGC